jgi:hypothetical protein
MGSGLTRVLPSWVNRYTVPPAAQTGRRIDKSRQARHAADPKRIFCVYRRVEIYSGRLASRPCDTNWMRFYVGAWSAFPCSMILNGHSGIKSGKRGTATGAGRFQAGEESLRSYPMRKIVLTLAALAAVGFVVPMTTSAKAEDTKVVIKHRGEGRHMDRGHHYGWDRGRHRGWEHAHAKKVVIIKKHGRRHYD